MSMPLPSPLPLLDRSLLCAVERVVPVEERAEWSRTWQAELWHKHHDSLRYGQICAPATGLFLGLVRDAIWLRGDSWNRALQGSVSLCLGSLAGLMVLCGLMDLACAGSWHVLGIYLGGQFERFLLGAPLVVFVSFATAPRRPVSQSSSGKTIHWMRRQLFFAAKTTLTLLLTFFLSSDVCQPVHLSFPNTANLLQVLFFVLFALVGLRWVFRDQEQRCKECLHLLAAPAQVGRPSYNLLEWNGTSLVCKEGHGRLSVPEMESSWCQSSEWVSGAPYWDGTASV